MRRTRRTGTTGTLRGVLAALAFAAMGTGVAPADEPSSAYVLAMAVPAPVQVEAVRPAKRFVRPGDVVSSVKRGRLAREVVAASKGPRLPRRWRYERNRFSDLIDKYAAENGVPAELAHAVIEIESRFRPGVRGRAGEIGLMQIKPATARMVGFRGSSKALFDPETNIKYGMRYLAKARKLGGEKGVCGTILKYNAGHAARRMNPISRRYCEKVKAVFARNAERWRIDDAQVYAFLDLPVPTPVTRGAR